jgi:holliday junction DNA helicase RuvA
MISRISGKLIERGDGFVVLDVNGVGYQVMVPDVVDKALVIEGSEKISLETIYYMQIDGNRATPVLLGFQNSIQREFFEKLLTVPKMGPKGALGVLSRPVSVIASAIETQNHTMLQSLPGVGRQKARDMVATLQGKLAKFALMQDGDLDGRSTAPVGVHAVADEALQLLIALGHKRPEAERLVQEALKAEPAAPDAETLVRVIYRRQQEQKKK